MYQYLNLLQEVLENGQKRPDRTGTGTKSLFGKQIRFDLQNGFPAVTTKKLYFDSVVHELLWFLRGERDIHYLKKNDVSIWDEWAGPDNYVGPIYGYQWRSWPDGDRNIDQIKSVIDSIQNNPYSRRHIVNAWNVSDIDAMALPPCHVLFQFYVSKNDKLSCQLYQRSGDIFLGVPFNIASYSLLTHMLAQVTGLEVGDFVHTFGDVHLYSNHIEQAKTQLSRDPLNRPEINLNSQIKDIDSFSRNDISLQDYNYHPSIKAPIAV